MCDRIALCRLSSRAVLAFCLLIAATASTPAIAAIELAPAFANDYTLSVLSTPTGVPGNLGGLTFLADGLNNTLLIGGSANTAAGAIYKIGVVRGAGGHITGFSGTASVFASAPYIDGGLAYGPGGVLFFTQFPLSHIGQIKPGSSSPDRSDGVFQTTFGNVGTLAFVPDGFLGEGQLKVASYNGGANFGTVSLTPDGNGTYALSEVPTPYLSIGGGPEGIAYVKGTKPGFGVDSVLISENSLSTVATYKIDSNGDPILGTRRAFLTGFTGVEGAFVDPVTGDFLFSTWGNGNNIVVVRAVPEPASWMAWAGLALVGGALVYRRVIE